MNGEFVVLAEYSDDLQAEVTRSMLYDADIHSEMEQEKPRGMLHRDVIPIRIMVRQADLRRARQLLRSGLSPFRQGQPDDLHGA